MRINNLPPSNLCVICGEKIKRKKPVKHFAVFLSGRSQQVKCDVGYYPAYIASVGFMCNNCQLNDDFTFN